MMQNVRQFEVSGLFGERVEVEFRWIQNGIAIRHADTVDVKFELRTDGQAEEKVLAFPHKALLQVAQEEQRPLTDSWVMHMAANHLKQMVETGDDLEKTLVTLTPEQVRAAAHSLRTVSA